MEQVSRPEQDRVRVKICGVTNLADAQLATDLGAWSVGMIFYPRSPRRCSSEAALEIAAALRRRVQLCGVYVNAPLEEIERDADQLGLALVQLHGDEGPAFANEVARRTGARVIKAAQVGGAGDIRSLERFHVDFHLVDARGRDAGGSELRGGTGETFDWSLLSVRRSRVPLILSGGINAGNVAEAIARARPYAIDSASGTESAPGHKDPEAMQRLFAAVLQVAADAEPSAPAGAPEIGSAA